LPDSNECTFYIEVYPYEVNHFELNAKGLEVDIYQDIKLQKCFLSNYKTKAGLTYVMAALSAKEKGLDDVFLSNDRGNILETSSCNVFVVSNGVLYTPGLDEGCLAGTMRMQVINLAISHGIKVYECAILPQNLLAADEIFVTNAIRGINWIGGYRTKRFFNNMSRKLIVLLNEHWEKELGI
jgi:branched-chain amino acid aminotransferase